MAPQRTAVVVSGHMVDDPGRPRPRFPPDQVQRVTDEVRAALDRWEVGASTALVTGGARGADIIAAEEAGKRGASIRLVLALPPDAFEERSVALPGTNWAARFRALLDVSEVDVLEGPAGEDVFARANARIVEVARAIDERPRAIIVWDGREGDGPGGTRDFVSRLGHTGPDERVRVIDPTRRA